MSVITNLDFLEAMFLGIPDDAAAMLAGFVGDPNSPPEFAWAGRPWQFGKALPFSVTANSNNYLAVSSFLADPSGKYRRRKDQFARLHAVMIDDICTKVPRGRIYLPLSALVETSPSNFQGWFFIEPTTASDDAKIAARLIEALIEAGLTADGKDPGMAGVTRYGRLPVGVNGKRKLRKPFRVRIAEWNPDRRYTVERIAVAHSRDLTPRFIAPHPLPPGTEVQRADSFIGLMQAIDDAGLYRKSRGGWHDLVCPWIHLHTDRCETGTAIREPSAENNWAGGFRCHHGHCEQRTIADLYRWARAYAQGAPA